MKMVWRNEPLDDHTFAFYYFCKRREDSVQIIRHGNGLCDLYFRRSK